MCIVCTEVLCAMALATYGGGPLTSLDYVPQLLHEACFLECFLNNNDNMLPQIVAHLHNLKQSYKVQE